VFVLIDGYGQETDLGLLYPVSLVPGGESSIQAYRPYGERDWTYAGDGLPNPEPWIWQGVVQADDFAALRAALGRLESSVQKAIRVRRESDGGEIALRGGSRPLPTLRRNNMADVTLSLYPLTDAWTVPNTRDWGEGDWGEGDWPDGSGFERSF
jgi:hypothetical protein